MKWFIARVVLALIILALLWGAMRLWPLPSHDHITVDKDGRMWIGKRGTKARRNGRHTVAKQRTVASAKVVPVPVRSKASSKRDQPASAKVVAALRSAHDVYKISMPMLAGMHQIESGGLEYGWWPNWLPAKLVKEERCKQKYKTDFCNMQWESLQHICTGQGVKLCNPEQVGTGFGGAFDLGPFQTLPATVVHWQKERRKKGRIIRPAGWVLGPHVARVMKSKGKSYINPLDVDEAAHLAASLLRYHMDGKCKRSANPLRCAINKYAGANGNYYETRMAAGAKWCQRNPGVCDEANLVADATKPTITPPRPRTETLVATTLPGSF